MRSESKIIAVKSITNTLGMAIHEVHYDIDDKVVFSYNDGHKIRSKVRYDENEEPYFMSMGHKHYLNEFMRV